MLRSRMKSGCSFGNAFHICVNTSTPQEEFTGLIERVTLGNGATANWVGEGRAGDCLRASFVSGAILGENPLADVISLTAA